MNPLESFSADTPKKIYSVDNGDMGTVCDCNGNEITYCISCNTETGEVEQFVAGPDGKLVIDEAAMIVARQQKKYPAPLRFEPAGGTGPTKPQSWRDREPLL